MNSDYRLISNLSQEDKFLIKKILDYVRIAENKYMVNFSFFLDERQSEIIRSYFKQIKYSNFDFFGGYKNAKRKIVMIFPDYFDEEKQKYPIVGIEFSYRNQDKLTHRDFLGSLMSLQIKRELIGDIIVSDGKTIVFVYETIADFIIANIKKVGSIGVKANRVEKLDIVVEDKFKIITGSVASLRLDCITSLVTGLSREKSALLIKTTGIDINYFNIKNTRHILKVGDVFSLRGYGKYIFESENGISKKGRKHITIKKYV